MAPNLKIKYSPSLPVVGFNFIFTRYSSMDCLLTLSPPLPTTVPYANSLNPDETPSYSSGSKLFDTQTTYLSKLSDIEAL